MLAEIEQKKIRTIRKLLTRKAYLANVFIEFIQLIAKKLFGGTFQANSKMDCASKRNWT